MAPATTPRGRDLTAGLGTRPARLLFVHAHPDDETLATGVAMAHHVLAGDEVHLLTCTLGEEGEVIPAELKHLELEQGAPRPADQQDPLAAVRQEELRRAMAVLGVTSHQVLGADPARGVTSRYRDSGMAGTPSAAHPRAFVRADPGEAAGLVAAQVRRLRPDVVVTYDAHGGYDHPDHIQTHRVTVAAVAALPERERPLLFGTFTPRSWAEEDRGWVREHVEAGADGILLPEADAAYPSSVVPDEVVTHRILDAAAEARRTRALREHRTQVRVFDGYYALSNDLAARLSGREGYAVLDPTSGAPVDAR
ncbi:MAG TPA: N-acetyl-1-D-myo-inositol-2-amino-2-deoxy-alpha-D-glucopyranoside deacetylase [Segeticoccus sp.]|uniref:N-acetyl-1-D-myo-inositol-2-amino-2-deoxy-alpha- D-glucopyranoside deacetylase n=1 Tax=Segeticoccus sp. TaxID=2706531 RepID=UPI002D7FF52D|nr:N-acetyl-1-D-myo-inositol-2-amino-2-deoxy-alpha-D-glucopyranoside deacetylase [Segeticoccus sp.]HET8599870.1 N-acetyl-1-D-myo-inositol-2-amino-2-deoxy-alpha-D-glucopyranoside deacetylase [Segeticoccus sp.]